jgi:hypothetical protein
MIKLNHLAIVVTAALFVSLFLVTTPLTVSASSSSSIKPCFYFTENGLKIGATECNAKANDLTVMFKPGGNCIVTIGTQPPQPCPKGANNIDVKGGILPSGAMGILSCSWTHNNSTLKAPCIVTTPPPPTGFTFNGLSVTKAYWTLNGTRIGKLMKAPTGANDVEFTV